MVEGVRHHDAPMNCKDYRSMAINMCGALDRITTHVVKQLLRSGKQCMALLTFGNGQACQPPVAAPAAAPLAAQAAQPLADQAPWRGAKHVLARVSL